MSLFPFVDVFAFIFYRRRKVRRVEIKTKRNFTSPFVRTWGGKFLLSHMIRMLFFPSPSFSRSTHDKQLRRARLSYRINGSFCTHLQFCLGHINLAFVDELNDELKVDECDFWRHDYDWMLARVFHQKFLEERRACGQNDLKHKQK